MRCGEEKKTRPTNEFSERKEGGGRRKEEGRKKWRRGRREGGERERDLWRRIVSHVASQYSTYYVTQFFFQTRVLNKEANFTTTCICLQRGDAKDATIVAGILAYILGDVVPRVKGERHGQADNRIGVD